MKTNNKSRTSGDCNYSAPVSTDQMRFSTKERTPRGIKVECSTKDEFAFYEGEYWIITALDLEEKSISLAKVSPAARVRAREAIEHFRIRRWFTVVNRSLARGYSS